MSDHQIVESRALLARYQTQLTDGLWHTVPDDGYVHAHLFEMFVNTGQADQMHAVLREETGDHRNGWYAACVRIGQIETFIQDVQMAWKHAEEQTQQFLEGKRDAPAFGLELRYALISASLTSLASNVPPELIAALVEHNLWTFEHALSQTRRMAHLERVDALLALIPYASERDRDELLEEALLAASQPVRSFKFQAHSRRQAHENVVQQLAQSHNYQFVIDIITKVENDSSQAETLTRVAKRLALDERWQDAIHVAQSIQPTLQKDNALLSIVKQLAVSRQYQMALKVQEAIQNDYDRDRALLSVAVQLAHNEQHQYSLEIAHRIQSEYTRGQTLADIAEQLAQDDQQTLGLEIANTIENDYFKSQALARVSHHLTLPQKQTVLDDALELARGLSHPAMAGSIFALVGKLLAQSGQPNAALELVNHIKNDISKDRALAEIAIRLGQDKEQRQQALEIATIIRRDVLKSTVISKIIEQFVQDGQCHLAIEAANQIPNDFNKGRSLSVIVKQLLTEGQQQFAVEVANTIQPDYLKDEILRVIAESSAQDGNDAFALKIVGTMKSDNGQAEALLQIAGQLAQVGQQQAALDIAYSIQLSLYRAEALMSVAQYLPEAQKQNTLANALEAASHLQNGSDLTLALRPVSESFGNNEEDTDYSTWNTNLHKLALETRYFISQSFPDALVMAQQFGGQADFDEAMTALHDVFRWWP